ncbi:MAG: sugar ABC transporter permease, partial [Firmicutes bacterium]|nr:sugar ABC transporter permease [Candidatus Caballimonas caccae]
MEDITFNKKKKWNKDAILGLIFILVPLIGFVLFHAFPVVISFMAQFVDMKGYDLKTMKWNSFANFKAVLNDDRFFKSIWITLWVASTELITLVIALIISVLLSQKVRGSKLFQVLFYIPHICSSVAVAFMWKWIFDGDHGLLNALLGTDIAWLNNTAHPETLTLAIIVAIIWQAPAYGIVMYKAAIGAINPSLPEAASLDGANGLQQFFHITIPSIAPTTFYLLFTGVLAGFMCFDKALLMAPVSWTQNAGHEDMGLTVMY